MYNRMTEPDSYACKLPLEPRNPFHPFTGLTVNFNVMTNVHYDSMDDNFCLLSPFGIFTGGELVCHDLGIIVRPRAFDWVSFDSRTVAHYNLHYKGKRGSFVLSTDRSGASFANNSNGWGRHLQTQNQ